MTIHFREHRATLRESLGTMVAVENRAELVAHVRRVMYPVPLAEEDLTVREYCYDDRLGLPTFIVTVRDYGVVGFTDGEL